MHEIPRTGSDPVRRVDHVSVPHDNKSPMNPHIVCINPRLGMKRKEVSSPLGRVRNLPDIYNFEKLYH